MNDENIRMIKTVGSLLLGAGFILMAISALMEAEINARQE